MVIKKSHIALDLKVIFLLTAFITFFILISGAGEVEAKEFHFDFVEIDVYINDDGSFDLVEKRTYDFDGDFRWATYEVLIKDVDDITDLTIQEGDTVYSESATGADGTSQASKTSESVSVKWFFNASNERRTFTIKYHAKGGVGVYSDIAEFYWKLIGRGWDKKTDKVVANIHLPRGAKKNEIRAWGHGPLNGSVDIISGELVKFEVDNLPVNTFVEGRVAFPKFLVPGVLVVTGSERLPVILEEEEEWAAQANRKRWFQRIGNAFGLALPLMTIFAAFILWLNFGKEYRVDFQGEYYRELPQDYPPAITSYLWDFGSVDMEALTATLMDIARKGYISFSDSSNAISGKGRNNYTIEKNKSFEKVPETFESSLIDFFIGDIGDSNRVTMEEIKKFAKKKPTIFKHFLDKWKNAVKREAKAYALLETTGNRLMYLNMSTGIIVAVIGGILISQNIIAGVIAILLGVLQGIASPLFRRRSRAGALHYAQWKAFRRYLKHFSNINEAIPNAMVIWEHYLVYAVALGVAKEVISQLKIVVPKTEQRQYVGPVWMHSSHGHGGLDSLSDISGSFSSLSKSVSTSMSSGSSGGGFGGGFSGGGGGGGGGGGSAG